MLLLLYSVSDLQPSAAISNQLPCQVVSAQIRTIGTYIHHSIDSALHTDYINSWVILYIIYYIAFIAGTEPTAILPAPDDECMHINIATYTHTLACMSQAHYATH